MGCFLRQQCIIIGHQRTMSLVEKKNGTICLFCLVQSKSVHDNISVVKYHGCSLFKHAEKILRLTRPKLGQPGKCIFYTTYLHNYSLQSHLQNHLDICLQKQHIVLDFHYILHFPIHIHCCKFCHHCHKLEHILWYISQGIVLFLYKFKHR